jgi:hypothetical protein
MHEKLSILKVDMIKILITILFHLYNYVLYVIYFICMKNKFTFSYDWIDMVLKLIMQIFGNL